MPHHDPQPDREMTETANPTTNRAPDTNHASLHDTTRRAGTDDGSTTGSDAARPGCFVDPRVERTHVAVIGAATELMMAHGPGAITHANVATAANVSRTTVYKYWPRRADLLRSTIEALGDDKLDIELSGDCRTDLGMVVASLVRDLQDDERAPLIATMMERTLHDPEMVAVRDEMMAEFRRVFASIIERAIESGQLVDGVDVDLAMASIIGGLFFIRFMSSTKLDDGVAGRILDRFVADNTPGRSMAGPSGPAAAQTRSTTMLPTE